MYQRFVEKVVFSANVGRIQENKEKRISFRRKIIISRSKKTEK